MTIINTGLLHRTNQEQTLVCGIASERLTDVVQNTEIGSLIELRADPHVGRAEWWWRVDGATERLYTYDL